MTQDKMRRIITACTAATTALLVFLMSFLIYQWIYMAVLDNKIERAQADVTYWTEQLEKAEDELEYTKSKYYLAAAWQQLQELESKK